MASKTKEYFAMAANGAGALVGGLMSVAGAVQISADDTPSQKVGGAVVMLFLAAAEYKFIRDTVRNYRAAQAASEPAPSNGS